MDNLDRMYRHLVRTVRARFPQYVTEPFNVAELHQTILPYRLHRRELGLDTNEDYEITLTQLLSGSRDYVIVDDQMRDALRRELSTPNPDPSSYKEFGSATVALSPAAIRSLDIGPDEESLTSTTASSPNASGSSNAASVTGPPAAAPTGAKPPRSATPKLPTAAPVPRPVGAATTSPSGVRRVMPEAGDRCRSCGEGLPTGRPITFCPHCGQNLTTMNCLGCGSELEVGWKFCPTCGRPAATA